MDNYLFHREIGRDKEGVCWGGGRVDKGSTASIIYAKNTI